MLARRLTTRLHRVAADPVRSGHEAGDAEPSLLVGPGRAALARRTRVEHVADDRGVGAGGRSPSRVLFVRDDPRAGRGHAVLVTDRSLDRDAVPQAEEESVRGRVEAAQEGRGEVGVRRHEREAPRAGAHVDPEPASAAGRRDQGACPRAELGRFVDSRVLSYMDRTRAAIDEYRTLELRRVGIQVTFAVIFGVVALLLLLAAVWVGLAFADSLATPIAHLIRAADRVRAGDLTARVPEIEEGSEVDRLSRAFNRMTDQLASQRSELINANNQRMLGMATEPQLDRSTPTSCSR